MQREWQVARRLIPRTDGERRWDHAYQHLLRWATSATPQEADDARRTFRPGLDEPPGAGPDHHGPGDPIAGTHPPAGLDA